MDSVEVDSVVVDSVEKNLVMETSKKEFLWLIKFKAGPCMKNRNKMLAINMHIHTEPGI